MDLLTHIRTLSVAQLEAFAVAVGTTVGHLRNVSYRQRTASAALAMQVEIETRGAVTRRELRPEDWWLIWTDHGESGAQDVPSILTAPDGVGKAANVGVDPAPALFDSEQTTPGN